MTTKQSLQYWLKQNHHWSINYLRIAMNMNRSNNCIALFSLLHLMNHCNELLFINKKIILCTQDTSLPPCWPAASDWKWLNHGDTIILAGSVSPSWVYHRLRRVPQKSLLLHCLMKWMKWVTHPCIKRLLLASLACQRKSGSVCMIGFLSENLSAFDWTTDQWPLHCSIC